MSDPASRIGAIIGRLGASGGPRGGPEQGEPETRLRADEGVDEQEAHRGILEARWARIVPPVYGDPTLGKFETGDGGRFPPAPADVMDRLTAWAKTPDRNLVLVGPVGTGKTYAAWAALRRVFGTGHRVGGIGAVDLLDALRPGGDGAEWAKEIDVLLIDDLGAHRGTEWTDERLYGLIHHRWEQMRPIVLTANVADGEELVDLVGERTYSRLTGGATAIRLGGDDRRKL